MPVSQPITGAPSPAAADDGDDYSLYDRQVPPHAAAQMEKLYGSLYASLPQLQLTGLAGAGTYVARHRAQPRAIFLYRHEGGVLRVINEGMRIDIADAERFAARMFHRLPALRSVHWHAVRVEGRPQSLPLSSLDCSEDIVLDLPATESAYLQALGKSTRKSLRQRMARANELRHYVVTGPASAEPTLIDGIIAFNHARLARRARRSALDASAASKLQLLMRARGLAGLVHIDGKLCGGTLACRIADDVYSLVNAHDPAFDKLGLGNLCRHLMILEAIRNGARRFHLLGGNYASKRSCLARRITLQHLVLYRDGWHRLLDWHARLGCWLAHTELHLRRRIDDARHGINES